MATQAQALDIWVWDPADREQFQHPGELPTDAKGAKAFFVDKIFGPKVAKISRATLIDSKKSGISMIAREDGTNHEVPRSRLLHWYEGLLILQEIEASGIRVAWYTEQMRQILEQERLKRKLSSGLYVEKTLLDKAVTGANYIDQNDKEHNFRRDKLKPDDQPDQGEPMEGFWKVDDITGYMPPWEAFCNQRCGLYQDFYQVRWEHFKETDFSNVENGCSDLGSTWEPDECVPPHMDGLRRREKQAWAKKRKDQEVKEHEARAQEAAENNNKAKRKQASSPQVPERAGKIARFRRDGKPLIRDMFRLSFGHDFAPEPLDDRPVAIRDVWPRTAEAYPPGFTACDPPGFCFQKCDCMDDQRGQQHWETSKNWLEDPQRTTDVLNVIDRFREQTHLVRRRGEVSKQVYLENLQQHQAEETQLKAALYLAKEVESQIQTALKDLPLSALMESKDEVRIPAVAFMKPGEDYAPVRFLIPQESSARSWAKIGAEDGVLSTIVGPPSRQAPLRIELHHPEGMGAVIDCLVTTSVKPVWQSGTASVVARFLDVQKCQLTRNARIILQERMSKIYDFEKRVVKEDISFGEWLSCMELTLRLLRSLAFANLVKSEVHTSRPPPRAAVARAS